ncbi:MAG: AAA family ATPase [Lachnospiraceae bacterium]|nr:AAA family ATPase [Lachnospiraceae bacterium]
MADILSKIKEIDDRLEELPKGTLTYKTINGKKQPYLQRTIDGKSKSIYIRQGERERILLELQARSDLQAEKERLLAYWNGIKQILKKNPCLDKTMSLGYQNFATIMSNHWFYVDKTLFIEEWFSSQEMVSLITRPRRFGKTLMMSTVDHFFSPDKSGHEEYFRELAIWKNKEYRSLYGTVPVIFLTMSCAKGGSFRSAVLSIADEIRYAYARYSFLEESEKLDVRQRMCFADSLDRLYKRDTDVLENAIRNLSEYLEIHYGVKPVILLDEYDTPLTEAYISGYWDEMIQFYRKFINATFKSNNHFQKAVITGVAKIAKNALFSDMNHVCVHSSTDSAFSACFGFTEQEVMDALQCYDIQEMQQVKKYYDGLVLAEEKICIIPGLSAAI